MIEPLFHLPRQRIEARTINAENPSGARQSGGKTQRGRKGRPCYQGPKAGESLEIADFRDGPGIVRHLWMTPSVRSAALLRGLVIEFFWDGAATPAISVPLGDFFGVGLGRWTPFESALFASSEGRNGSCFIPMPFRQGFRIVLTNQTAHDVRLFFAQIDFTVGDELPHEFGYLHAHFNRENPTTLRQDYAFLPLVRGKGRYLGANFGVRTDHEKHAGAWWGEGEVKIYTDGDGEWPTYIGTGTEDYIGTAWGQGRFSNQFYGSPICEQGWYAFYRYHLHDPIYFDQEIRGTIQQIGYAADETRPTLEARGLWHPAHDAALDAENYMATYYERQDDWSSCAYFTLDRPENDLPALLPVEARVADLLDDATARQRLDA